MRSVCAGRAHSNLVRGIGFVVKLGGISQRNHTGYRINRKDAVGVVDQRVADA